MINIKKITDLSEINKKSIYGGAPCIPDYIRGYLLSKINDFYYLDKLLCLRYIEYTNKYIKCYRRGLITSDELLRACINFTYDHKNSDFIIRYLTLNY